MEREEKVLLNAVLCFLIKDNRVLLARKAKKIGKGCWNGYGGGIEKNETEIEALKREVQEESGVEIEAGFLEKMAVVDFHNTKSDGKKFVCTVHVYAVWKWKGEPVETSEMLSPTWFEKDNLPFNEMMPADQEWLPYIFEGKKIRAKAFLGPFQKESWGKMELEIVEGFWERK